MNIRFLAFLLVPLLAGCTSIRPENMVADAASLGGNYNGTVALDVGGGDAGAVWYSETVNPQEFEQALRLSINNSKIFRQIVDKADADYVLSVNLTFAASHPGFDMTAWIHANWTLSERASGRSVWTKEVDSEGKATVDDEFVGAARQDRALERAVKANIESGLSDIGSLQLK